MKVSTLALAALISAAPAVALAQNNTLPSTNLNTGVSAGATVGSDAAMDADANFDAFIQGFGSADFTAATSSIATATDFEVVKLSAMADADPARLKATIDQHQADIAGLHAGLSANGQAAAALDAAGVSADQVVWIETAADGKVKLYVNDLDSATM